MADLAEYAERNRVLRAIGFRSYGAYLRSALWAAVRRKAFARNGRLCTGCGGTAVQLHHTRYTRGVLLGLGLDALLPVCRQCHEAAEFTPAGAKRSLPGANQYLRRKAVELRAARKLGSRP